MFETPTLWVLPHKRNQPELISLGQVVTAEVVANSEDPRIGEFY